MPLPDASSAEVFHALLTAPGLRIERIVSHGQGATDGPWMEQAEHEWVLVLSGAARLGFADGESVDLVPGSFVNIPAGRKHRVEWTASGEPTVWLAIHYVAS